MNHKRLLIVDDDDNVRRVIEMSLQVTTDWEVFTAASGEEGLKLAQTEHIDAILLDVMMPGLDGIETLLELRANTTTQAIPVIFLTAKALVTEQQKLKSLGIQGLISKPFDALGLYREIRRLLQW